MLAVRDPVDWREMLVVGSQDLRGLATVMVPPEMMRSPCPPVKAEVPPTKTLAAERVPPARAKEAEVLREQAMERVSVMVWTPASWVKLAVPLPRARYSVVTLRVPPERL